MEATIRQVGACPSVTWVTLTGIIELTLIAIIMLLTITLVVFIRDGRALGSIQAGLSLTRVVELAFSAKIPQGTLTSVVAISKNGATSFLAGVCMAAVEILTEVTEIVWCTDAFVGRCGGVPAGGAIRTCSSDAWVVALAVEAKVSYFAFTHVATEGVIVANGAIFAWIASTIVNVLAVASPESGFALAVVFGGGGYDALAIIQTWSCGTWVEISAVHT